MARIKLNRVDKGKDDLAIMFPDQTLTLNGEELLVREYRFVEGTRLLPVAAPIIERLRKCKDVSNITVAELDEIAAEYIDNIVYLISVSIDAEPEWIENLNLEDGQTLLLKWWQVNSPFLLKKALYLNLLEVVRERDGQTSETNSSNTGMPQAIQTLG